MGADHAAGGLDKVVDRPLQPRSRRIGMDIENEDLAGIQAAGPEVAAVIREAAMMRLVATAHRNTGDHLAIGGGAGTDIDRDQLVRSVTQALDAKGPDIDILLLAR